MVCGSQESGLVGRAGLGQSVRVCPSTASARHATARASLPLQLTELLHTKLIDVGDDGRVDTLAVELLGHHAALAGALKDALDEAVDGIRRLGCQPGARGVSRGSRRMQLERVRACANMW